MLPLGLLCFVLAGVMLVPLTIGGGSARHASQWIGGFAFLAASLLLLWLDRRSRRGIGQNAPPGDDADPVAPPDAD